MYQYTCSSFISLQVAKRLGPVLSTIYGKVSGLEIVISNYVFVWYGTNIHVFRNKALHAEKQIDSNYKTIQNSISKLRTERSKITI